MSFPTVFSNTVNGQYSPIARHMTLRWVGGLKSRLLVSTNN